MLFVYIDAILTTKQLKLNWTKFSSVEPVEKESLEAK